MFCGKCGAKNMDDAVFCGECGERISRNQHEENSAVVWEKGADINNKNRMIGIIIVVGIVFVLVVIAFALFGGRSYKSVINTWFEASFEADAEAIIELIPEEMIAYMLEEEGMTRAEFRKEIKILEEELQEQIDDIELYLGDDWEVTYSMLEEEKLTGKALEEIKEFYEDIDVKISAARAIEIEVIVSAKDMEESQEMEISLIKIGRNWCIDMWSMDSLFL